MAADGKYPSAKAFKDWLPARAIRDRLYPLGFATLSNTLADRLRVNLAEASGGHLSIREKNAIEGPWPIPPAHWKELKGVSDNDLWRTGQLTVWVRPDERSSTVRYDFYDVRFEPGGIDRMLEGVEPAKTVTPTPPPETKAEKYERKGHATDAQLRAWYSAYKAVYGGTVRDTLPFAWDSALGIFPEKEVSRDSVRKIIAEDGPRDPGPKPKK